MAALMGNHRFEGKIFRIGIALECLCIDGEQITFRRVAPPVLCASRLAVNMPILDAANEAELPRDASRTVAAGVTFRSSQGTWR